MALISCRQTIITSLIAFSIASPIWVLLLSFLVAYCALHNSKCDAELEFRINFTALRFWNEVSILPGIPELNCLGAFSSISIALVSILQSVMVNDVLLLIQLASIPLRTLSVHGLHWLSPEHHSFPIERSSCLFIICAQCIISLGLACHY